MFGTFPPGSFMWTQKKAAEKWHRKCQESKITAGVLRAIFSCFSSSSGVSRIKAEGADRWVCWRTYSTDWWVWVESVCTLAHRIRSTNEDSDSILPAVRIGSVPQPPAGSSRLFYTFILFSAEKWGVRQDYSLSVQLLQILAIWVICSFVLLNNSTYATIRVVYIFVFYSHGYVSLALSVGSQ